MVDHIVPIWRGGAEFDPANLQVLCKECDAKKTAKDRSEYENYMRGVRVLPAFEHLFNEVVAKYWKMRYETGQRELKAREEWLLKEAEKQTLITYY